MVRIGFVDPTAEIIPCQDYRAGSRGAMALGGGGNLARMYCQETILLLNKLAWKIFQGGVILQGLKVLVLGR